jgi:hypothetical protein
MGKKGRSGILAMSKKVTPPPPPRLLELLDSRRPLMRPLVLALREQILREAPDAIEFVYSTYVVGVVFTFSRPGKAFCHVAAYEKHVNLGFNQGALLDNRKGLLVGTGKKIRHIRIASKQDLKLPLRGYLREAIERARAASR